MLVTVSVEINATAQNVAGVYKTQQDYVTGKLSEAVDLATKGNCFWENHSMVLVMKQGKNETKYFYGEAYGYLLNGNKYRAVPKSGKLLSHYGYAKLIENGGLKLYSRKSHGYKMSHMDYYYSVSDSDLMRPLNRKNLGSDFASYPEFVNRVNLLSNKHSLYAQDSSGKYELNKLFCELVNKECLGR